MKKLTNKGDIHIYKSIIKDVKRKKKRRFKKMKEYLVEAIKEEDGAVVESWDLFTYSNIAEAIAWARSVAHGSSEINAKLMGYDYLLVHEVEVDDYGSVVNCQEIASFKVK